MEMERINDNLIKVIIKHTDLFNRGINFLDLVTGKEKVEEFFHQILEEVDIERQFADAPAVTFQILPRNDSLELYISRNDSEDNEWDEEIASQIFQSAFQEDFLDELEEELEDENEDETEEVLLEPEERQSAITKHKVVAFSTLEDFIQLSRSVKRKDVLARLYMMNGTYYLVLDRLQAATHEKEAKLFFQKVLDFGEEERFTEDYLIEHGKLIHDDNPLDYFGNNF